MAPLLYDVLVPWYYLVDPTADHEDEATCYGAALAMGGSLLELGSGGGNNLSI